MAEKTKSVPDVGDKSGSHMPTFDTDGVPLMLEWAAQDVGLWMRRDVGFPQYENCFVSNFIDGRKLILVDASTLPKLGVYDFEDIKIISQKIRELLGGEEPFWNRSISLPPRDAGSHFLERKSTRGTESDALKFEQHIRELEKFNEHAD